MIEGKQLSRTEYTVPKSEEEIIAKALKEPKQQKIDYAKETTDLNQILNKQTPPTQTPPTKTDILIELIEEREKLKTLRQQLETGKKRPSKQLTALFYTTQLIISANKIILEALKENIQINNMGTIDITTEIRELIKISRETPPNDSPEQSE